MRSPTVWAAMVATMEADAVLTAIFGSAIYLADGQRKFEAPSLTGTMLFGDQGERFTQSTWQLDAYCRTMPDAIDAGEALLRLFDHDVRRIISGLRVWTRCTDDREFHGPVENGVYRRSLDFEVEVIRRRYVRTGTES